MLSLQHIYANVLKSGLNHSYPYERLTDEQFEELVISVCKLLFGIACKSFSKGPDGGKDSWFEGTATAFPSTAEPWTGKTCIQAKHTIEVDASCSDNKFSVNQSSVLEKEITRLKEIQETNPFDNYLIFTNRKLPGESHSRIVQRLKDALGIKKADIIGREDLNKLLGDNPEIAYNFGLYKFDGPLRFYEKDLKSVIETFNKQRGEAMASTTDYIDSISMVDKETKNQLNDLTDQYFEFMKDYSLPYFGSIDAFLKNPKNATFLRYYQQTVADLQELIVIHRAAYSNFDLVLKYLTQYMVGENEETLRDLRDLVRVFVHFMYFNCDIGRKR